MHTIAVLMCLQFFEVLMGAFMHLHSDSIAYRLSEYSVEPAEPSVKKSSK